MFSYPTVRASFIFLAIALGGLLVADIAITTANPWQDLGRFFLGVATPNFFSTESVSAGSNLLCLHPFDS